MKSEVRNLLERNLLGVGAPTALAMILSSLTDVEQVYLAECRPLPPLQQRRNLSLPERNVFNRAVERRKTGLAFWDAALLELTSTPEAIPLLDDAMTHVSFRGKERSLSWESAVAEGLERMCTEFQGITGASLTFLSEVKCGDGLKRHLPMIDFHSPASDANLRIVTAVAEKLFPTGAVVLDSGESYHAYGTELVSETELRCFLGRALLFAPIVDRAYVAHQLIEGRCALRLTAGGGKSRVPTVVALVSRK